MSFILVALGGAIGALARYAISLIPLKSSFPFLTLVTNLLGAVIIGLIVGMTGKYKDCPKELTLFLKTGFCGGFTTFSTFSLETCSLLEAGKYFLGGLYAVLSLTLCLIGVFAGKRIANCL